MEDKNDKYYTRIATAKDLCGKERIIYRLFEMLPGIITWTTLLGIIIASWLIPVQTALFIIIFDLYWVIKTAYLSFHLRANWKKLKHYTKLDWQERLKNFKYDHLWQMILMPFYKEDITVVTETIESLLASKWPKEKMIIVLGYEERAGETAKHISEEIQKKYGHKFGHFLLTEHPKDILGELPGKGSNIAYAAEQARKRILDTNNIKYEDVIASAFDIDTHAYPQYFLCVAWHFLTAEKPFLTSYQPVPVYNNNIWDAPAFSRVVATSGTFWQMIQQERPERLATFSSHSISFKTLYDMGYWQVNMVSEDSRIFWQALLHYDGDYAVAPISYPVSLDANLAPTFWRTAINVYKQQRRWGYGTAENASYMFFGFLKNKKINLGKKLRLLFMQIEGSWSLATNPIIIFFLGWLPLVLGGEQFNQTLIAYNLPRLTRELMTIAMAGLIMSAMISTSLLPPIPNNKKRHKYFMMIIQWILIPLTIPIFGAIPGIDAQTRLMLGKYMGFWSTPKYQTKKCEGE